MSATADQPDATSPEEEPQPRHIDDAELHLLADYTGERDLSKLREHVLAVWRRAISGPGPVYLCIRGMYFLEPRLRAHPAYQRALQDVLAARAAGAVPLWLDVGAAMGTDVRQLRVDGLAQQEVVALDIPSSFWALGLDLYRDAARPPCEAVFGDITQDDFLPPGAAAGSVSNEASSNSSEAGGIRRLAGAVTVASCTAVLHCLGREDVNRLLSKTALLLRPGGLLLGSTLGAPSPREWEAAYQAGNKRWLHSVESLREALEGVGFTDVDVAPTTWRDLSRPLSEAMQGYVGNSLEEEGGKLMLAFSGRKRTASDK